MSGSQAKINDLNAREEQRRLSKAELLQPRVIEKDEYIEALGGTVRLRSLTHAARTEIRDKSHFGTDQWDEDRFTTLGIIYSIVEPELTEEDIEGLRGIDANAYDELVLKISLLNMLGHQEQLGKDSSETPS